MGQETTTTTLLEVYDPAMCCSTGVCGSDVDDQLVTFAQDLKWLETQGVSVRRYNLGQESEMFRENQEILRRLQQNGVGILPIILVNGEVVSEGKYPDREQLSQFTGNEEMKQPDIETNQPDEETNQPDESEMQPHQANEFNYSEKVDILVAIGSSVASGCENCLKAHFVRGKKAGLAKEDMARAMQSGLDARQVPMSQIVELANKLLGNPVPANGRSPEGGCC